MMVISSRVVVSILILIQLILQYNASILAPTSSNATTATTGAQFTLTTTTTVDLFCSDDGQTNTGSCAKIDLFATNAADVSMYCGGPHDSVYEAEHCGDSNIYVEQVTNLVTITADGQKAFYSSAIKANNANRLIINCLGATSGACDHLDVYPPFDSQYVFTLKCLGGNLWDVHGFEPSCGGTFGVRILLENPSFSSNFMDLTCNSSDNLASRQCGVSIYCPYQTIWTHIVSYNGIYQCSNGLKSGTNCCPWTDYSLMQKPQTPSPTGEPSSAPTHNTYNPTSVSSSPTSSTTQPSPTPTIQPSSSPTDMTMNPSKNPSKSPSFMPSKIPTKLSVNPTKAPTSNPSNPSNAPTKAPSGTTMTPSKSPTLSTWIPTKAPIFSPTLTPTKQPSTSPVLSAKMTQHLQDLDDLETFYETVLFILVGAFVITACFAWIHSKWKTNDYFKISQISATLFQTLDMLSDCFFSVNVSMKNEINPIYFVPLILSIVFIIIPSSLTIMQLYFHSKKHWIYSSDQVRGWMTKRAKPLYLLSMITGNAFAAVSLVNSYMFGMDFFDMGLTDKELIAFTYKRVYSVILLENIPQLCIQIWFLISLGAFAEPITISSIIFSLISIIVSILSMSMQKGLSQSEGHVGITIQVTGTSVMSKIKHCKISKKKLDKHLASIVCVHNSRVQVIKPIRIKQGLELNVNFYFLDVNKKPIDYYQILMDAQKSGDLQTAFKQGWNLDNEPTVDIISQVSVQSKKERKRSEKIRNSLVQTQTNVEMVTDGLNDDDHTKLDAKYDKVSRNDEEDVLEYD
eukprot:228907_1